MKLAPLIAVVFVIGSTSAFAQQTFGEAEVKYTCRERFAEIPGVAKRLGVAPGQHGGFSIKMCNGTEYDVTALIVAALNRVDKIERALAISKTGKGTK